MSARYYSDVYKRQTELDARTLDLLLILQAEHGGGNNSTFTVRVTSSTGTDTVSYTHLVGGVDSGLRQESLGQLCEWQSSRLLRVLGRCV